MVTADAMKTSARILEKTRADAGDPGEVQHKYSPDVVERLLSLMIEPLAETTKCAKVFRADMASVDGEADAQASELVKVYNGMAKVYASAKEQLESSVFQFVRQHRRIFDESFRANFPDAAGREAAQVSSASSLGAPVGDEGEARPAEEDAAAPGEAPAAAPPPKVLARASSQSKLFNDIAAIGMALQESQPEPPPPAPAVDDDDFDDFADFEEAPVAAGGGGPPGADRGDTAGTPGPDAAVANTATDASGGDTAAADVAPSSLSTGGPTVGERALQLRVGCQATHKQQEKPAAHR